MIVGPRKAFDPTYKSGGSSYFKKACLKPHREPSPWQTKEILIAAVAIVAIVVHLVLRYTIGMEASVGRVSIASIPLLVALVVGGIPLVGELAFRLIRFDFSSDLLAGISIVTAVLLGEYLAGTLVVLMLSGGQAIEAFAVRRASSALSALAQADAVGRPSQRRLGDDGYAPRSSRGRRSARRLSARNLPGGRRRRRRPQQDGRVVPDGRAVRPVQGRRLGGHVRCRQRRRGADDPGRNDSPSIRGTPRSCR